MSLKSDEIKKDFNFINDSLINVYDSIMRIEESELRKSRFKDITAKEVHLVHTIGLHDRKTTSQVARILKLSKGTLTANLNTLERKGYVMRIANQEDRRIINLGLTSKGRLLYRAHDAFHRLLVERFLKGFDDDDIRLIKQAMINLEDFIDEVSAK
ncbi:DNA-binding transcriptional repressor MarR [Lentilactobacillus parabuchneri]|jgi:DNA-binding MarR family transcriptional regulator|uniref:DNA-binding transcriptional repressor MarR n=2 Tax=Lentilactobacillus parabuchneri TaxID=152331 RepID=A0A1X1FDR7_9LACO|nr:MarR family transcriptional regulator [Lentilactobacillus parabuchneri]APR07922.1 DNA-binding transcriptional repressor MarR [Lentilactobacillus parabuchneri]KRM47163.1 regulatory protein MarR [Lentilactobacillus parabuchneri DSM 5707 = NBRC 107865]KRN70924.1 regulatory protein MarR [Lentilactobacillus parabuchneri]MBW0222106.1 MarR family transcriptional regulator [Lentilactobacillus parabuchneri]MBW0263725.1 MarR family transcriptional regulator [Lentilactobacillus parabuchneri]